MKFFTSLIAATGLTACLTAQAGEFIEPTPSSQEAARQFMAFAAGHCRSEQLKTGVDFTVCFRRVTDLAISKLQSSRGNPQ